jgi:hypothetical protein
LISTRFRFNDGDPADDGFSFPVFDLPGSGFNVACNLFQFDDSSGAIVEIVTCLTFASLFWAK